MKYEIVIRKLNEDTNETIEEVKMYNWSQHGIETITSIVLNGIAKTEKNLEIEPIVNV